MRIGITCYPTYGGSGAVATELGLELARRGHDVHFIAYASPFRLRGVVERVTFHEVAAIDYPLFEQSPHALALAVKQHEVAQRERLDLLHVHYAIPFATTAWLAKQMMADDRDLKVVTTLHGTDITLVGQDPSYFTITKFSIERSDRVTAVSQYLREETYRAFGCDGCDVAVITNFISTADYYPPADGARRRAAGGHHRRRNGLPRSRRGGGRDDRTGRRAAARSGPARAAAPGRGRARARIHDRSDRAAIRTDLRERAAWLICCGWCGRTTWSWRRPACSPVGGWPSARSACRGCSASPRSRRSGSAPPATC